MYNTIQYKTIQWSPLNVNTSGPDQIVYIMRRLYKTVQAQNRPQTGQGIRHRTTIAHIETKSITSVLQRRRRVHFTVIVSYRLIILYSPEPPLSLILTALQHHRTSVTHVFVIIRYYWTIFDRDVTDVCL